MAGRKNGRETEMRRSGILIATAALVAALVASESAAAAEGHAKSGGIYPWYRYGYNFPYPYGATPPTTEYVVTGRSVTTAPVYEPEYKAYCAYGYDYPFGCPFLQWEPWYYAPVVTRY
jgi:hypothetical protein